MDREEVTKWLTIMKANLNSFPEVSSEKKIEALGEAIRLLKNEESSSSEIPTGSDDCISREQALVTIRNLYPGMPRVDFNGSLRKWVDKYKPYIECEDAIEELPSVTSQEPKWIPVSERLPEERELVLLSTVTDNVFEGRFFDDNTDCQWYAFRVDAIVPNHIVTAWMPLPKPYEPQESEG